MRTFIPSIGYHIGNRYHGTLSSPFLLTPVMAPVTTPVTTPSGTGVPTRGIAPSYVIYAGRPWIVLCLARGAAQIARADRNLYTNSLDLQRNDVIQ